MTTSQLPTFREKLTRKLCVFAPLYLQYLYYFDIWSKFQCNNNNPQVLKYRSGVLRNIDNRLMAGLGSSAMTGRLSSDGFTIKILLVMLTHINLFYEMLQINEFNLRGPELPESSVMVPKYPQLRSLAGHYLWRCGIKIAKKNYYHLY